MDVRVRNCCCALHTFVRILCILLTVLHLVVALAATGWHLAITAKDPNPTAVALVAYLVVLGFCLVGSGVNLLVLLAVKRNQRSLMIPWLVFQVMVILGLFAIGLYVALYYTVLAPPDQEPKLRAYSVLCLFPLVTGIFLIFCWILVDQLFIQMKTMKKLGLKSVSTNNLSHLRGNGSYPPSNGNASYHYTNDTMRSVRSVASVGGASVKGGGAKGGVVMIRQPNMVKVVRRESRKAASGYQTQSLPRSKDKRHHKVPNSTGYKLDLDTLRMKRAKSLEHILDSSGSSSSTASSSLGGPHIWVGEKKKKELKSSLKQTDSQDSSGSSSAYSRQYQRRGSADLLRSNSNRVVSSTKDESYCTIDRSRLRRRQADKEAAFSKTKFGETQTLPRKMSHRARKAKTAKRSRSMDLLKKDVRIEDLEDDEGIYGSGSDSRRPSHYVSSSYIGDMGIDELKRVSSEHVLDRVGKSVTIHPNVTEFHYPGDSHEDDLTSFGSSTPELHNHPRDNDDGDANSFDSNDVPILQIPEPPVKPLPLPNLDGNATNANNATQQQQAKDKNWLQKISSPLVTKPGYTKDQIIGFYCQAGDVQL